MSDITIRPATEGDVSDIHACAQHAFEKYIERIGKRPAPMDADFMAQIRDSQIAIALSDGNFAGYVTFFPDHDALHLDAVAVLPEFTGQGIGKLLIAHAEASARAGGFKAVELYTNEMMLENLLMYPSLGYVETGQGFDQGYNRVFFRKDL